jgi:bifunctional DNase/RNase
MLREMKISVLAMDERSNTPIVVLRDPDEHSIVLCICIGIMEATAIATEIERIKFFRPMTHDLITNLMTQLGITVARVEICDLKDSTFYAWIHLTVNGRETKIDARPSDALAIALRMNAQIFVADRVLEKSKQIETRAKAEIQGEEAKKWAEILEGLSPEDFGKYKV